MAKARSPVVRASAQPSTSAQSGVSPGSTSQDWPTRRRDSVASGLLVLSARSPSSRDRWLPAIGRVTEDRRESQ